MLALTLTLKPPCGSCGAPLPLRAQLARAPCPACKASMALDRYWKAVKTVTSTTVHRGHSNYLSHPGLSVDIGELACADCEAALDLAAVAAAARSGSEAYPCPSCAAPQHLRAAPAEWQACGFEWFVGEDPDALAARPSAALPARPVVFKCPNCNGALHVDGSTRAPDCPFCHVSAFLPDELWRLFHPVVQLRRWSALFDEDTYAKQTAARLAAARDPKTPDARLLELVAADEHELQEALIRNPGLSEAVQLALAPRLNWHQSWAFYQANPKHRRVLEILKEHIADDDQKSEVQHAINAIVREEDKAAGERKERAEVEAALAGPLAAQLRAAERLRIPADLRARFDLREPALAAAFAASAHTPPEVLTQLDAALTSGAHGWDDAGRLQVALALAGNPHVAPDALTELEKKFDGDAHKQVHAAARKNPSYPSLWHRLTH